MIQYLKSYMTPLRLVDAEGFCPRRFASAGAGLLLLVTLLFAAIPSGAADQKGVGAIIFVDAQAAGANTGTSWEDAFLDLQSALDAVTRGNFDQIWVACAEYRPTRSVFKSEDPRTFSFTIDADLRLFGGFVGGETALEERNPDPRSNGCVLGVAPGSSESEATRPYSVLRMESAGQPVLIDGFTISGGRATGPIDEESQGAGIRAVDSRLTLRSMHFEDLVAANNSAGRGAGVFAENAELVLEDVSMLNVSAGRGAGVGLLFASLDATRLSVSDGVAGFAGGAALDLATDQPVTIRESVFVGNLGNNQGGVIRKQTPGPVLITRSSFLGNRVGGLGSVIAFTAGARMAIDNSLFVGNETTRATNGGVISIAGSSPGEIILTNVTMVGNESGAAVLIDGVADVTVQNSILVDNRERGAMSEQIIQQASASGLLTVRYSLVQGGFQGEGNLSGDPVFVRQPAPEEVDAGDFGDLRLDVASPAIDAGDNLADLDGAGDGVTTAGDLTLDLAGNVRRADMPDVPDSGLGDAPIIDLGAFEQRNLLFSDGFEEGQPGL